MQFNSTKQNKNGTVGFDTIEINLVIGIRMNRTVEFNHGGQNPGVSVSPNHKEDVKVNLNYIPPCNAILKNT